MIYILFLTANILLIINHLSAQDEQRLVKKNYKTTPNISGSPIKILKQTSPNKGQILILYILLRKTLYSCQTTREYTPSTTTKPPPE
jgi:predicted small secreted protein